MAIENCRKRRRIDHDSEEAINPQPCPISNLGDDVLAEVLIRLPEPGSAWRCKAVCKRWNSLISDPQFVRRFISHHHQQSSGEVEEPPLMFPRSRESILSFLPLPDGFGSDRCYFKLFDSYKDLVLCGFDEARDIHAELWRSLFLCNPFTKQWIALPLAPRVPSAIGLKEARLVCEPRNVKLDIGQGRPPFTYSSAYRFRVVCIYHIPASAESTKSTRIDVFCSESGEWTKEALIFYGRTQCLDINVVSTYGGMVWLCLQLELKPWRIVGFNPFRLDTPPIRFDVSRLGEAKNWNISVSQGALHLILLIPVAERLAFLSVWRLAEDRKAWSVHYKALVRCDASYELKDLNVLALHPEKPHIVFIKHRGPGGDDLLDSVTLSCDMKTGELRFLADFKHRWMVFQPRVSCWPTPIPKYEELRGIYDGRHSCWVQQSKAATLSLNNCGRVVKKKNYAVAGFLAGWRLWTKAKTEKGWSCDELVE